MTWLDLTWLVASCNICNILNTCDTWNTVTHVVIVKFCKICKICNFCNIYNVSNICNIVKKDNFYNQAMSQNKYVLPQVLIYYQFRSLVTTTSPLMEWNEYSKWLTLIPWITNILSKFHVYVAIFMHFIWLHVVYRNYAIWFVLRLIERIWS